jgi:signal transduction histidine kinase/DNA-binding NarL/FixJ family response regulator
LFHVTLSQARTALDRVAVYNLQIDYYWSQRNLKWLETGRTVLAELGVALPVKHFKLVALLELIKIQLLMRGRTPLVLLQLPTMTDTRKQAAMQILVRLGGPAMDNLPDLLSVTTMYLVRLSLRYGNAPFSGVGFGMYGLLLLTLGFGKVDDVYALVKAGITLTDQTDMQAGAFLQWFGYAGFAAHYKEPLRATWPLLQKVMTLCLERGEFNWYGCVLYIYLNHRLIGGDPLDQLLDEFAHLAPLLKKFRVEHFEESVRIWWQLLLTLSGTSAATWQLTGPIWDETTESPRLMAEKKEAVWDYYFSQLWLAWLTEDWSTGLDYCRKIAQWKQKLRLGYGPVFDLFYGICVAEQATTAQGAERRRLLFRLWRCRRRLRKLAQHCVANYQHKYLLLAAESARLQGKLHQAMQCYDEAIAGARQHQFLHEEALANERAACFYLYLGRDTIAAAYLQAARTCYARWGCFPKVKLLEETYPHLIGQFAHVVTAQATNLSEAAAIQTTETVDPQGSILDVATLLRASQALAQEVRLDHLLHRIMQLMLENAGADRGVLLLKEEEEWLIQAHASPGMAIRVLQRIPLHSIAQRTECFLSTAIAEYVMRTHESLVLEDAVNDSHFGRDSYVQQYQAKSLLCQPLVHQGRLTGLLYLENTLTTNAFTPQRLELLNSLVSYAAISLENAHLYAELAEHSRSLEQRVTERTRELEQSNRALQQAQAAAEAASRAKSTFLAHISHELRTPLTAILGYTQLLRCDRKLTDKQQEAVAIIHRSGEHLLLLINDLLDLSKIEAQKMELTPHSFPLLRFLNDLIETFHIRARQKEITLNAEIPADLPIGVYADERRLRQILVNLLNNAIKFTEKGSVTLRVSYCDGEMGRWEDREIGRRSDGEVGSISPHPTISPSPQIRFEVEDTGIGIPLEHLQQIFLSFHQVKNFSRQEGSGLGLTISQQLVRLMGSELYVKSTIGQGSTFWFDLKLPVVEEITTNVAPQDRSISGFTGTRRKILVVDDNPENREFLCDVLFSLTFELREAANGREAIEITREWQPHLILMDLVMPVMDGFEATRQIRKLEIGNSMLDTGYWILDTDTQHPAPSIQYPVIIGVSANILESIGQKSFAVGCDDFLAKPLDIAQLLNCLQQHLQLEWLYSDTTEGESELLQASDNRSFVIPPPDVLRKILEFAEDGDMTDLHQCLAKLKTTDPRFIQFVERIEQLAGRFQFEQIVELIQQVKS